MIKTLKRKQLLKEISARTGMSVGKLNQYPTWALRAWYRTF